MQWVLCGSELGDGGSPFFSKANTAKDSIISKCLTVVVIFEYNFVCYIILNVFGLFFYLVVRFYAIILNSNEEESAFIFFIAHVFCPEGALWLGISCSHICEDQMFFLGQLEIKMFPPLPKQLSARTKSELN